MFCWLIGADMKIQIKKDKKARTGIHWTACEPFLENTRGALIHRVRYVTTHKISPKYNAHLAVSCWCGMSICGQKNLTFIAAPPSEKIVCARCEDIAVQKGLPTSYQLTGKHIHTGGVVAVKRCCDKKADNKIESEE